MTILMTSDMPGVTHEDYDRMVAALGPLLTATPGFITHVAGPIADGFRVTELWETEAAHSEWYTTHVARYVPDGAPQPRITMQEITKSLERQ